MQNDWRIWHSPKANQNLYEKSSGSHDGSQWNTFCHRSGSFSGEWNSYISRAKRALHKKFYCGRHVNTSLIIHYETFLFAKPETYLGLDRRVPRDLFKIQTKQYPFFNSRMPAFFGKERKKTNFSDPEHWQSAHQAIGKRVWISSDPWRPLPDPMFQPPLLALLQIKCCFTLSLVWRKYAPPCHVLWWILWNSFRKRSQR